MDFFTRLVDQYDTLKYALLDAQTFDPQHFGFPPLYYKVMETDQTRIGAFRRAFEYYDLADKVVCEAGVGTLALAEHYLPRVRKAYLIENNPELRPLIKQKIAKAGWTHKVELIYGDARTVKLPEPVDFIIGELMSIFCANEFQVAIFAHLRQFLRPGGKLIPEQIINTAQIVNADFSAGHRHYPINFSRHLPELLSLPAVVNTLDLYSVQDQAVHSQVPLSILLDGSANGVLLRSLVSIAPGINFTGTDSLMPPTVCQLTNAVAVKSSQSAKLKSRFYYGTDLGDAAFRVC